MSPYSESDEDTRAETNQPAERASSGEGDPHAVATRQTTARRRVIQVGVALTVLLVVGGLIFGASRAAQLPSWAVAGGDYSLSVAILSNVNHGTLTVNGTQLDVHLPVIVTLRSGANTLTLSAPPFRPHTCTIDMARLRIDGAQCTGDGSLSPGLTIGGQQASSWLDLPLTLADLSTEQQHRVAAAVAEALAGTIIHTTVPAHQYITIGMDTDGHVASRLTDEELQADATLVRVTPPVGPADLFCVEDVCTAETGPLGSMGTGPFVSFGPADVSGASSTADTVWRVATFVTPHWRFTTRTGTTAAIPATSPLYSAASTTIEVALHYDATHGWRQWNPSAPGPVPGARDAMANVQCYAGMMALSAYHVITRPGAPFVTDAQGIEGCEIHYLDDTAHFIWRFGVLLAADEVAHGMIPDLPVAAQAEIDAVTKQA